MTPAHAVELLIAFANSVDADEGTDDLTTPAQLGTWLSERGLLKRRARPTSEDLILARLLRDGMHEALVAHHEGTAAAGALDAAAAELPLRLLTAGTTPTLGPVHEGVRGALTLLLVAVTSAAADGRWQRLKICGSDECGWAYFDTTKNQSRAWCEWGCGNKIKTRNYRARKKAAAG